ncbi:DUF2336 domain-containing protein [Allosphingosinicella indica]|uniref:Uncharacterized conserved protein, DUF2336 family n=1 Tax=Allosphingosinicella indica TaxID=941907 RepID=A0A1X7GWU4_9SPHN|nr:DUF2336 domain-containing protein [Allosphingosinicella indica]SMF75796.1 Uncharacterized conserved protein, DUF2336 family [Allosphingosinicella indica]
MSEGPPNLGERGSDAARLLVAAARRHAAAGRQLAIPEALRLSEQERRIVAGLADALGRAVEDELRTALAVRAAAAGREALAAALSSAHVAIAGPLVDRSGFWRDGDLLAVLLRRVEEHRLNRAAASADDPLPALIRDGDEEIATEAMAVLIARSRRLDRIEEPLVTRTELPADIQHRLVWTVAAGLRLYMTGQQALPADLADAWLAEEAANFLAHYDEGDTLDARCARLAVLLDAAGRLDDDFLIHALGGGSFALFLAAIALRARLAASDAWTILSDTDGRGAPLLLRAAGVGRHASAALLLALAREESALAPQLDLFDLVDPDTARAALRLWRTDPAYRAALARMLDREAA